MTPEDKLLARELLEQGRLTVDRTSELISEAERTGRGFREIARERGLLPAAESPPPPRRTPLPRTSPALPPGTFAIILVSTALLITILIAASVIYLRSQWARDEAHIRDSARNVTRAHQLHEETILKYQQGAAQRKEADVRAALGRARELMDSCENLALDAVPPDDFLFLLVTATNDYTIYLDRHPEDAPVFAERARAWELRRNPAAALTDLDMAVSLQKDLGPSLGAWIERLRLRLRR